MPLLPYLDRLAARHDLTAAEAQAAMRIILAGQAPAAQIAGFAVALRVKGETAAELTGLALAMREAVTRVDPGLNGAALLDTCGTGGDSSNTFNISTLVAFVVAGAGVYVAKHGNRAVTSPSGCGSADLLESFGIAISPDPALAARAIREAGIGFLYAPGLHASMKHAGPVRKELRLRTVFNLLGPLTNPAGATAQLVGAPSETAASLMAEALAALGLEHGFVVHGADGLDEITTTGTTLAFEVLHGHVERRTLEPADFAVRLASPGELTGGSKERNYDIARKVLDGARGAPRDIVIANAAAALVAAGQAETFLHGAAVAAVSIDSGAAWGKVQALRASMSSAP